MSSCRLSFSRGWGADSVATEQHSLYRQNDGLHLFRSRLQDGAIAYEPQDLQSTEATAAADLLQRGDRLEVHGQRAVKIYRGSTKLGELSGEDIYLCAFHCVDSIWARNGKFLELT
jgi:hypothetical protein